MTVDIDAINPIFEPTFKCPVGPSEIWIVRDDLGIIGIAVDARVNTAPPIAKKYQAIVPFMINFRILVGGNVFSIQAYDGLIVVFIWIDETKQTITGTEATIRDFGVEPHEQLWQPKTEFGFGVRDGRLGNWLGQ